MGYSIRQNTKIAIKEETTEGTFVPASTGSDFIQVTADGLTMDVSKDQLERDLLGNGLAGVKSRSGMWNVSGGIKTEMKANGTEGEAPEYGLLMESCLGASRSVVTKTSDDTEGGTYSTTVICMAAADVALYSVGDIISVKVAGDYHTSPIVSIATNELTLLVAADNAFVDGLEVAALITYLPAESGHKSISVSKYIEDSILEQAAGCKVKSMSMEGFTTGAQAFLNFAFEGLSTDRSVSANSITPTFDAALPPIILEACVYQDGIAIAVNDVTFSIENELGFIKNTCSESGKTSSRITKRSIKGTINPYKQDDSVANWTKFKYDTSFSIYFSAKVPTGVDGEYKDIVACYMPECTISTIGEGDLDGILQDTLEFNVSENSIGEFFLSFI